MNLFYSSDFWKRKTEVFSVFRRKRKSAYIYKFPFRIIPRVGKGSKARPFPTAKSRIRLFRTVRIQGRGKVMRQKIMELESVLDGINGKVEEYEDALVRKLIERITVYDDYYTVEFKSGIEIDVQL